jgi:hypothetical protein
METFTVHGLFGRLTIHPFDYQRSFTNVSGRQTFRRVVGQCTEDDGEGFVCDEELRMLAHEQGFRYCPIALGMLLHDGKLDIVRKLGWAGYSCV